MENAKIRNESSISISLSLMAATGDVRVYMINCILCTMFFELVFFISLLTSVQVNSSWHLDELKSVKVDLYQSTTCL